MTKRTLGGDDHDAGHGKMQIGTPEARAQLQNHCGMLNSKGGSDHWFIRRLDTGKYGIDAMPKWKAEGTSTVCTPEEARQILREHPSSFGRVMDDLAAPERDWIPRVQSGSPPTRGKRARRTLGSRR